MTIMRRLLLLTSLLAIACSSEEPEPFTHLALWEVFQERVASDARPTEPAGLDVFRETFDDGFEGWLPVIDVTDPLAPVDDRLRASFDATEGALRLEGQVGAMYQIVKVDPETYYDVRGRVRFDDLVPTNGLQFAGGTYFVGELTRYGDAESVFGDGLTEVLTSRKTLGLIGRGGEWEETSYQLRTAPETRALLIVCILGLDAETVASGAALFDDVAVRQLETSDYYRAVAENRGGTPADLAKRHGASFLRVSSGGVSRPSLIVYPGENVEFTIPPVKTAAALSFHFAAWPPDEFGSDVDLKYTLEQMGSSGASWNSQIEGWCPVERELKLGLEATLTFQAVDTPVAIGSPSVRPKAARPEGPNLILISIDTLRADRVGAYGYDGDTTPVLDQLASEGSLFADMTAQAPFTLPSQATIFSGQVPSVHGLTEPGRVLGESRTPMLAQLLFDEGIVTRGFTAGGYVDADFGMARGFEAYSNIDPWRYLGSPHADIMIEKSGGAITPGLISMFTPEAVNEWIEEHADERFFLFLHTYTVHDFDPPPEFIDTEGRIDPMPYMHHEYVREHGIDDKVIEDINAYYDGALRYVDGLVGDLRAKLSELDLAKDTILVVTSDHGKEIGDRGSILHGTSLYEELVAVPLIIRVPGKAPSVDTRPVMSIDVAPTCLALMGVEPDERMQGVDLFDPTVSLAERSVWSEVDQVPAWKYALRTPDGWKLIHGPPDEDRMFPNEKHWELFDLSADPNELTDLTQAEADRYRSLRAELSESRDTFRSLGEAMGELGTGSISAEMRARLEQLGYL